MMVQDLYSATGVAVFGENSWLRYGYMLEKLPISSQECDGGEGVWRTVEREEGRGRRLGYFSFFSSLREWQRRSGGWRG